MSAIRNPKGLHHTEHETGGVDAIAALDGSILTTGTLPDARLSANVARRDQANTFAVEQTISKNPNPALILIDASQAVNQRVFRVVNAAGLLWLQALDDAVSSSQGAIQVTRLGALQVGASISENGRSTPLGYWLDVPYSGSNFVATGSLTWTVDAGDVSGFAYTLVGKTMVLSWYLLNTTLGGTTSSELRIVIPGGFTASRYVQTLGRMTDSGGDSVAVCQATPAGAYISIFRQGLTNYVLGNFHLYGSIVFPVT